MATPDEVMTFLGKAIFAAQNFELNVGTLLLVLTVEAGDPAQFQDAEGNRDEAAVVAYLNEVDRLTLGQLKGKLAALNVLDEETVNQISSLNADRRRLVHYFVPDYAERMQTDEGRTLVLEELNQLEQIFTEAWHNLHNFLAERAADHLAR